MTEIVTTFIVAGRQPELLPTAMPAGGIEFGAALQVVSELPRHS